MHNTCLELLEKLESREYKSTFLSKRREACTALEKLPFTTRLDLQKLEIPIGTPVSKTSGSTGIPVIVPKTRESILWANLTNLRELKWRKWDLERLCVVILAGNKEDKVQNNIHSLKLRSIADIQKYLVEVKPSYLYTYPSIISLLDLELIPSLIDIKSVGEIGGTNYSSEETGTIALRCPDYPEYGYHVMENIIVENHPVHGAVITDLSNPYITRYIIGDVVELAPLGPDGEGLCPCGRILPVITKIQGRKRNMLVLPNGDKIWPAVGEPLFRSHISQKILRHRVVQTSLTTLEIQIDCKDNLEQEEIQNLKELVLKTLGYDHLSCEVTIMNFPDGKFEAFISRV